jgi:TolA-binding protein
MNWLAIMMMAVLLAVVPGYGSAQTVEGKNASPATQPKGTEVKGTPAQAAKSYTPQEREAYQQKVAGDLAKLQERIDALQGNYEKVKQQMKRTTLKTLQSLKKQHFTAQNQLAALEKAPAKDWGGLKVGMDKAMNELMTACQEAESRLQ